MQLPYTKNALRNKIISSVDPDSSSILSWDTDGSVFAGTDLLCFPGKKFEPDAASPSCNPRVEYIQAFSGLMCFLLNLNATVIMSLLRV